MRKDIQRLRAYAVLLVVGYHLFPNIIPGGFIGVDVFFVISGFLITSHLLDEAYQNGKVQLLNFWARRIRRLLPAAFFVLGISALVSIFFLPRTMLIQQMSEIAFASVYILNWPLAVNSVDYLASSNDASIAQQYWSLSVEEQFYFFWPLLLISSLLIAKKFKFEVKQTTFILMVIIFAVSYSYSIFWTNVSPGSAYFMTTTRAWEFAAGGLIAFFPRLGVDRISQRTFLISLGMISLTIIPFWLINSDSLFPGWIAILPVLATVILIWVGSEQTGITRRFLRFQPLQFIGGISYELYLWHWPIIIFVTFLTGAELGISGVLVVICSSLLFAFLTKRFVDDPVRNWNYLAKRPSMNFIFAASATIILLISTTGISLAYETKTNSDKAVSDIGLIDSQSCYGAMAILNDCASPYAVKDSVDPLFSKSDNMYAHGVTTDSICEVNKNSYPQTFDCILNDPPYPSKRIVLVGDSHSFVMATPLKIASINNSWYSESWSATAGCRPFEQMEVQEDSCTQWAEDRLNKILLNSSLETVIISFSYDINYGFGLEWISKLISAGKEVLIIRPVPGLYLPESEVLHNNSAPDCVQLNIDVYDPCAWKPDSTLAAIYPANTKTLDTWEVLCSDTGCHSVIGGEIVYFDSNHMTTRFSETLHVWLEHEIKKIE